MHRRSGERGNEARQYYGGPALRLDPRMRERVASPVQADPPSRGLLFKCHDGVRTWIRQAGIIDIASAFCAVQGRLIPTTNLEIDA
jgi:hypothetical protein